MRTLLGIFMVTALVACPAALAHGGGLPGYTSTVTSVEPTLEGVTIEVVDREDRVRVANASGRTFIVEGYDGEPYLKFTPRGVFENVHSPAVYLNEDRYGNVTVPPTADAKAAPEWKLVTARDTYEWHDHRIHWMSPIGPPMVREDPDTAHHVFDWSVPGEVDGKAFTIAGSLDYAPPPGGPPWVYLAAAIGIVAALALLAKVIVTRRRHRSSEHEAEAL